MNGTIEKTIFPITAEYFCEIQAIWTKQPVFDGCRELFNRIVPFINDAYRAGKRKEPYIPLTHGESGGNPDFCEKLFIALEAWRAFAYEAGSMEPEPDRKEEGTRNRLGAFM